MIRIQDYTTHVSEKKSKRKELCLKPTVAAKIRQAALAVGMDESTFIASAAYRKAQEVEQSQYMSLLDDAQFDAFAAAVDTPGKRIEALAKVMEKSHAVFVDG
jgi:uncharacterized protein (DUF1778 family)